MRFTQNFLQHFTAGVARDFIEIFYLAGYLEERIGVRSAAAQQLDHLILRLETRPPYFVAKVTKKSVIQLLPGANSHCLSRLKALTPGFCNPENPATGKFQILSILFKVPTNSSLEMILHRGVFFTNSFNPSPYNYQPNHFISPKHQRYSTPEKSGNVPPA